MLIPILAILVILIAGGIVAAVLLKQDDPKQTPTYLSITSGSSLPDEKSPTATSDEPKVVLTDMPTLPPVSAEIASAKTTAAPVEKDVTQAQEAGTSSKTANPSPKHGKTSAGKTPAAVEMSPAILSSSSSKEKKPEEVKKPEDLPDSTEEPALETSSAVPSSEPAPSNPPTDSPAPKTYTNMNQLKAALQRGEINNAEYAAGQADIRAKRAAELKRLKADYVAGKITKDTYNIRASQTKQKYETGSTRAVVSFPSPSSSAGGGPSQAKQYTNMRELKTALRQGTITRAEYSTHQRTIREKRAAEYATIKNELRSGKITKAEYEQKISAVRRKYEGN